MSGAGSATVATVEQLGRLLLQREVEQLYYEEAALLDERRFEEWLDLLTVDIRYFMPLRRNVRYGQHAELENSRAGVDAAWFDEGKETLIQRVKQIGTGIHWAEEPLSRVSHLVTNVRITSELPSDLTSGDGSELDVESRFLVYRNRVEDETDVFVGKREDRLRRTPEGWRIAARTILLDQSVLLAKNLTLFF